MPMVGDSKYEGPRTTQQGMVSLRGWFTIAGGAGAIGAQSGTASSTSGPHQCGVTVALNATGDYRLTLHRGYRRAVGGSAHLIAPVLATAPTGAQAALLSNATNTNFTGAVPVTTTSFGIQTLNAAGALANPQDLATITYEILVAEF